MAIADTGYVSNVREQLLARRVRLEDMLTRNQNPQFSHLLHEVDQALERVEGGSFGVCEVCLGTVESERLLADPLARVCLECLSPQQQRALEFDLELAAQVQNGLLPPANLSLPGWEVSHHFRPVGVVSGDYYDLMSDGKGGLNFILADVAGKGLAAAMLSSNLRAMFRTLIPLDLGTEKLLAHASRLFRESTLPSHYATLVFGKTTASGEMEIVNAGHLPVLLVQKTGITVFESDNLPLGMFSDQTFTAAHTQLSAGDTLVLYTDGISEAENLAGEEYGTQALRALIESQGLCCPESLVRACRENVDRFRGDCERHDDETLLAIQYAPAAETRAQIDRSIV